MINQKFWTYQLNNSDLTITESFGLSAVSVCLVSGSGTINGNLPLANGYGSTALSLTIGQPVNFSTINSIPIDNLEISTTGIIQLIGIQ